VLCATFCSCNYITPYKEYLWNMQLQTTSPESKFPKEYSDVIFIQIDQHLKKLLQNIKGSRFYESRCSYTIVRLSSYPPLTLQPRKPCCRRETSWCHYKFRSIRSVQAVAFYQSAVLLLYVVCPSVTLVDCHIHWDSRNSVSQINRVHWRS